MNAVLPDDLSHYENGRNHSQRERDEARDSLEGAGLAPWEGPDSSELDSSPGMTWVAPEKLVDLALHGAHKKVLARLKIPFEA